MPREGFRLTFLSPYMWKLLRIETLNFYTDNDCAEKLSRIEILNFHVSWRAFVSSFFLCASRIEIFEFLFSLSAFLPLRDDHRRLEVIESRNFESPRVAKDIYLTFLTFSLAQREILIFYAYREDHSSSSAYVETRNFEFPRILNNDRLTFLSLCTWNLSEIEILNLHANSTAFALRFFLRAHGRSILLNFHASWWAFALNFCATTIITWKLLKIEIFNFYARTNLTFLPLLMSKLSRIEFWIVKNIRFTFLPPCIRKIDTFIRVVKNIRLTFLPLRTRKLSRIEILEFSLSLFEISNLHALRFFFRANVEEIEISFLTAI